MEAGGAVQTPTSHTMGAMMMAVTQTPPPPPKKGPPKAVDGELNRRKHMDFVWSDVDRFGTQVIEKKSPSCGKRFCLLSSP